MIHRLSDFSDLAKYQLPFIVIKPSKMKYRELAVRVHDLKWPTVRYVIRHRGREFRIKEFFMDWFFLGFPKSLLKDFSSTYSEVESALVKNVVVFMGKNYRNNDAASAYIHGTHVEIDCGEPADREMFISVFEDLLKVRPDPLPLSGRQFPDRSHFSKGYGSEWYEDLRISRMQWRRTPRDSFRVLNHNLRSSGMGFIGVEGKVMEIFILEEKEYESGLWIELVDKDIQLDHAYYNIRKGDGFYDHVEQLPGIKGTIIFRSQYGPGILRLESDTRILTVGFSPGFSLDDIKQLFHNIEGLYEFLETVRNTLRQADAYL